MFFCQSYVLESSEKTYCQDLLDDWQMKGLKTGGKQAWKFGVFLNLNPRINGRNEMLRFTTSANQRTYDKEKKKKVGIFKCFFPQFYVLDLLRISVIKI